MTEQMRPCPRCGGKPILCEPNYADEGGTMVVCEDCDFASDSFVMGVHREGSTKAIESWNAEEIHSDQYRYERLFQAARRLESDMRSYVFDKTPDRRIQCLDAYRKRLGLKSWHDEQEAKSKKIQTKWNPK